MAQAAFFVNDLKIIDQGACVVIEAQRRGGDGQVVDQVFLAFPAELKRVLAETASPPPQDEALPDAPVRTAWRNRMEAYFDRDS